MTNPDKPAYTLVMGKVETHAAAYVSGAFMENPSDDAINSQLNGPAKDVQIEMTPAQALAFQRMAAEYVRKHNPPGTSLESEWRRDES